MKAVLAKHYVVVNDPTRDNKTTLGVVMWMFTAEQKEIRCYSWGTGNCLIGAKYTDAYHNRRSKEMARVLTEASQVAAGELRAAEVFVGKIKGFDAEKKIINLATKEVVLGFGGTLVGNKVIPGCSGGHYGVDAGKGGKELELKLSADTKITRCLYDRHFTDATNSPGDLKSKLTGAEIEGAKVITTTDKNGVRVVHEVQLTVRPGRR